jgi:cytochrome c oxidase subunit IV
MTSAVVDWPKPEHVVSTRVYYGIFAVLLVLTAVTVAVASIDLGPLNTVVALSIAVTKAVLVILYFMHLRYSTKLTWLVIGIGFAWLGILIAFTLSDTLTRAWLAT